MRCWYVTAGARGYGGTTGGTGGYVGIDEGGSIFVSGSVEMAELEPHSEEG